MVKIDCLNRIVGRMNVRAVIAKGRLERECGRIAILRGGGMIRASISTFRIDGRDSAILRVIICEREYYQNKD